VKDVIIRGRENIYPAEIEDLLPDSEDFVDTCVVGVPDLFFGEEACAFVILRDGAVLDEAGLRAAASHQKVPSYRLATESLPKTASGKVRRFILQQAAVTKLGLDHLRTSVHEGHADNGPVPTGRQSQ
jgi:fatty-acyl-CoA synthase